MIMFLLCSNSNDYAATSYYWPSFEDHCTIPLRNVIGILREHPQPKNTRTSHFTINYNCTDKMKTLFNEKL